MAAEECSVTVSYSGHHERLVNGLWTSLQDNRGIDFQTQSMRGHRLVLDVFLSQESVTRITEIDCQTGNVLDFLLEFLYTGRVSVPRGQLEKLSEVTKDLNFEMLAVALADARACSAEAISDGTDVILCKVKNRRQRNKVSICDKLPKNTGIKISNRDLGRPIRRKRKAESLVRNPTTASDVPPFETEVVPSGDCISASSADRVLDSTSSESDSKFVSVEPQQRKGRATRATVGSKRGRASRSNAKLSDDRRGRATVDKSRSTGGSSGMSATKKHSCPDCSFACVRLSDLKVHVLALHCGGVKSFKCEQCEFASSRKSQLNSHIRGAHLNNKPCLCDLCGYRTTSKCRLERHKLRHSEVKAYVCDVCGEAYRYQASLWRHAKRHAEDAKPYMCHLCGHSSREKHSLKIHLENAHKGTFKCRQCDFWCSSCVGLGKHRQTAHPNTKPFPCTECDYSCRSSSTLLEHMRRHTGERPFKCDICSKTFAQLGNYDIHVRKHLGIQDARLFSCSECAVVFGRRSELRRHLRSAHKVLSTTSHQQTVPEFPNTASTTDQE